jgi:hypothetical protein
MFVPKVGKVKQGDGSPEQCSGGLPFLQISKLAKREHPETGNADALLVLTLFILLIK